MPPELKAAKNRKAKLEQSIENMDLGLNLINKKKQDEKEMQEEVVESKEKEKDKSKSKRMTLNLNISLTNKLKTAPDIEERKSQERESEDEPRNKKEREKDRPRNRYNERKKELKWEEAKTIFMALLKEKNVNASWRWKKVHRALNGEKRYRVIPKVSDKKKVFNEYIQLTKKAERNLVRSKIERARNEFKAMLMDFENLTSDSKWTYCVQFFYMDPRYQNVDEKEREGLFQDYLDELYDKERMEEKKNRADMIERMKEHFQDLPVITTSTSWEEAQELLKYNAVWQKMNDFDRLEAFSEYILTRKKEEDELSKKRQRRRERINRLAFRELLKECVTHDSLTFKTKWRSFVKHNQEDLRLFNMFKQRGSSPRDIFYDVRNGLRDEQKKVKEDFKNILKKNHERFHGELTVEKFMKVIEEYDAFKKFEERESNSLWFYASYLLDKLNKRIKKAKEKFLKLCIKEVKDDSTSFDQIMQKINEDEENANYLSCLSKDTMSKIFGEILEKVKNGEDTLSLIPAKKKKKKKKKDRRDSPRRKRKYSKKLEKDSKSPIVQSRSKDSQKQRNLAKREAPKNMVDEVEKDIQRGAVDAVVHKKLKVAGKEEDSDLEQGEIRAIPRHLRKKGRRRRKRMRTESSSTGSSQGSSSRSGSRRRRR